MTSRLTSEDVTLGYGDRVVSTRVSLAVPDGAFTMETRYCRPAEFEQEYGAA